MLVPVVVAPITVFFLLGIYGGFDAYWMRSGTKNNDTPDLDCVLEVFKTKVKFAEQLRETDIKLAKLRDAGVLRNETKSYTDNSFSGGHQISNIVLGDWTKTI